ncbi:uncharacterized protein LOC119301688 [Triticum dicoccoides]|uniref:uncharacterized protein LOC119301688 n=1 Tax=Triticum dicoccoides TaxID=85692 RepID=UPI00188EEEB9|nr:uncharacterized protein LOC119301688 [Triticum dicoccoides]
MEFAARGRETAAADGVGVGDGRRLPDPPPPHGNDADSPQADMVALVLRREQLLHELHKERIRHDMILCELAQTERAMTACLAGLGALRGLSLMTPREEVMYRTPRSSEEASWWYRSPSGQVIPPVYPHVERSPSPVPQRRPVDDAEQQERGSSSRPAVATPSAFPEVELFRSLSKDPAVEALVPAVTNVVAKPAEPALLRKEVAIESRAAVDHEHEAGLKHRHAVQLMENGIQISEQLKRAAIGQESKAGSKDSHAVQLMESGIQISQQLNHVAVGQGSKAEAKDSHPVQLMESGIRITEQLKRASIGQGSKAEAKDNHAMQLMESGTERSKQLKRAAVGREIKAEVKDNHALQLMESELQRTEQPNLAAVGKEQEAGLKDGHAVQLLASGIQINEELKRAAVGQERKAEAKDSHVAQLMENKIQRSEKPKRENFGQEREAVVKDGNAVKLTVNRIQRSEQPKRDVSGQQHEAEEKDRHAVKLMEESGIQGSEQPKPAKPTMKDCIDERRQSPHQHALAGKKSPFNEQKRPAFNEPNTQTTPSGVKRRPVSGPVVTTPSPKRQKPLEEWNCTLCQVNLTCEEDLMQHKAGDLHRLNLAALRSRQKAFGFDLRNHLKGSSQQESTQALHTEAGSHHPKGRSHQESAQTRQAGGGNEEGKRFADRRATEGPRKEFVSKFPFCKLCKVQYSSEKVKESHLAGKKHRENLQARH